MRPVPLGVADLMKYTTRGEDARADKCREREHATNDDQARDKNGVVLDHVL